MTSNPLPGNPTVPLHFKKKKKNCHMDWFGFGCRPWREREDGEDGGQRECRPQRDCVTTTLL